MRHMKVEHLDMTLAQTYSMQLVLSHHMCHTHIICHTYMPCATPTCHVPPLIAPRRHMRAKQDPYREISFTEYTGSEDDSDNIGVKPKKKGRIVVEYEKLD